MRCAFLVAALGMLAGCAQPDRIDPAAVRGVRRIAVLPPANAAGRTFDRYAQLLRRRLEVAFAERGYEVVPAPLFDSCLLPYPGTAPEGTTLVPAVDTRRLQPLDGYLRVEVTREPTGPTVGCTVSVALFRMPDRTPPGGPDPRWPVWEKVLLLAGVVSADALEADAKSLAAHAPSVGPPRR